LLYAPVEHPNRPLKDNEKVKFKRIGLCVLALLLLINMSINNTMIINCVTYGVLLAGVIATPLISKIK
jgi:accessory gene regulator protein AgrB